MDLSFPVLTPKITKDYLLSKNSEETYMKTYLGVPITSKLFCSPLRADKKPTASLYRNKNKELVFHDFGTGFHANFIGVVMEKYKCDYHTALITIAEDFHLIPKRSERPEIKIRHTEIKIEEKPDTIIQIENKPFTQAELKWWESYGVHEKTLKKFKVFSCASFFINGNYSGSSTDKSFIFGYYGGIKNNNELWRLYMPQKKTYRFLSNWESNMIQGAKQLPVSGEYLILVKSLKDTMCLYENDIIACAPCSENILINKKQLDKMKSRFKRIFLFWDNDTPGRTAAKKYKDNYSEITCIELKPEIAKDISDCYKINNNQFQLIISELKEILSNKKSEFKYFNVF